MKVVLDAWACVALMKNAPAAERVDALMNRHAACMSSINLGEAYYSLARSHGRRIAMARVQEIRKAVDVEDPDWLLVRDAADVKASGGLSYADAFCVAMARRHRAPLYTGDPEIIRFHGDDLQVVDLRSAS